jgi:hypothetical protein
VCSCDIGLARFGPKYLGQSRQEPCGGVIAARSRLRRRCALLRAQREKRGKCTVCVQADIRWPNSSLWHYCVEIASCERVHDLHDLLPLMP